MSTKIFCDIADIKNIKKFNKKKLVKGFTTNPSLMRKAGAKDYKNYAKKIIRICKTKPISLEVFADNNAKMLEQAFKINSWGKNVFVKIPITNSKGNFTGNVIKKLNSKKIKLNITAVYSSSQTKKILKEINKKTNVIISIFAGRAADTGKDPIPEIKKSIFFSKKFKNVKILWASVRETFNYNQALRTNTDIITVPPQFIKKIKDKKISLENYSKITVKQFFLDGKKSKFKI